MRTRVMAAVLLGLVAWKGPVLMAEEKRAAAPAPAERPAFSGIYPHLAVTNGGPNETGIGAVVPWADRLWLVTYPAHVYKGGNDKLYEVDAALNRTGRPESVGGTHANRMIHRESGQAILGPYFIDSKGTVRAVPPAKMPGRMTATARHLTDPAGKVYFVTMEEGLYEVDVRTLDVKLLHQDTNVGGKDLLPGTHGKGAYTGQGRLIVAHNGKGGVLAEWDGQGDPGAPEAWTIVDKNKYTDVTGPGGIYGAPAGDAPVWAIGWDARSVLLAVRDGGRWTRFRLPKASFTHDADHGWYTEWPRIREAGGRLLMNMHGMFYDFPGTFSARKTTGLRPISTFLKMVVDYADFGGRLVMAANDASRQGNAMLGCCQSNLWFVRPDDLQGFGRPAGWGGPWLRDAVKAGQPSEPFLLAGFDRRVVHLGHNAGAAVTFTLETDAAGDGKWTTYASVTVPASGYAYHVIPPETRGEWIRVKADRDLESATASFHYASGGQAAEAAMFASLAAAGQTAPLPEGILHVEGTDAMTLTFAAAVVNDAGKVAETGLYRIGEDLRLRRVDDAAAAKTLREKWATKQDFRVDGASVIMTDKKGGRWRLPMGPEAFSRPGASGWPRGIREVVTERNLMNIHGTFYELPRDDAGGLARVRPICTHQRRIFDFASWRGMLVLAGARAGAPADGHYVASDDGKVGLWLGNVDDLWKLGLPRGEGGPWRDTAVTAGAPSDAYLMTGYDRKVVRLSHDGKADVRFTIEVDFLADGTWHTYDTLAVPAGKTLTHTFPAGFSAHWVRVKADADCKATAWFVYNPPQAARAGDDRIVIETDCLTAEVWPTGYVSGVKADTLVDRKTGARDGSFGLDIVDFLLGSGAEGGLPYAFGDKVHGQIAKHYVERPQICTQAKRIESEFVVGRDFVAVRQGWRWTEAAPGLAPGSRWEQTLVFPMGRRGFLASDRVECANDVKNVFLRLDMPGHLKHNRGDTFEEVYLSYEGRIPASDFLEDFAPDARHLYQRGTHPLPARMIRARKIRGEKMPWLAGITLDPRIVSEAWCHQRGYVCFIEEIGGLAVRRGDQFAAAYHVGYFDTVQEMEAEADRLRGYTSLAATKDYWLLSEGVIRSERPGEFRIGPQGRWPAPATWRVLAHGEGEAVVNGRRIAVAGEQTFDVPREEAPAAK